MSDNKEEFALHRAVKNEEARKRLGIKGGFFWTTAKKLSVAVSRCIAAMDDKGFDEDDFKKPVRVNLPVVNDLPPEGVFDTEFCNRYERGGKDGLDIVLIPGAAPADQFHEQTSADDDARSEAVSTDTPADSDDTAGDPLPAYEYNVNGESMTEVLKEADVGTATLPFIPRFLHIWYFATGEGVSWKDLHWASTDQRQIVARAEMDQDDKYIQNLLPVIRAVSELDKLDNHKLSKLTEAIQTVFPPLKSVPQPYEFKNFITAWREAKPIDRGVLVKEWAKGNCISRVETSPVTCNTAEPQTQKKTQTQKTEVSVTSGEDRPRRSEKPTFRTINYELACGFYEDLDLHNLRPAMDFAKRIIAEDREDWKQMSMTVGIIPDIKGYDRQTIIDLVRKAPKAVHNGNPDLRRTWCESFLAVHGVRDPDWYEYVPDNTPTTHEENTARLRQAGKCLRDIEAGRFQCDEEKPQPAGELADEPAAPEAVEQDATEHHQDPQPLENEPSVSQTEAGYQKLREELEEARKNIPPKNPVDVGKQLAAARGEYVEGISDPNDPKWVRDDYNASNQVEKTENATDVADATVQQEETSSQPEPETSHSEPVAEQIEPEMPETAPESQKAEPVTKVADGVFDVSAFFADTSNQVEKTENHQPEADVVTASSSEEELPPSQEWPEFFEPGRYEGVPNDVYHAANGISSTMVKDARVSLMYYEGRHVSRTIQKERSGAMDMGSLVHALVLQPEILGDEFSIEPEIPEGALTNTATIRAVIDEYNATLPPQLSADEIKARLEEYNASLQPQLPPGASLEETGQSYMALPAEFQRIEADQKKTATAMKACIKEYNATLPAPVKTSGSRDALLEQLAIINPDLVAQEAQKPQPLKVSGTKAELIQAVKTVKPDAVFADELLDAWRENPGKKIMVTRQQYATAQAIQSALYAHPEAGKLLQNPERAVEVSYFGIDDDTGLDIRVRPDVELEFEGQRIGFDLKTISMWGVKEDALKSRLHREITLRDYHLSAGMYCDVADLDKFAWVFVNKDEGYHWVAVVWASDSLLELGKLEYRRTIRAIANAMDTGEWPAPITKDYTDELNDYDLHRLEALREMA
ncbi:TPA: DNA breaking-rejoining protein [Salmonella enterica]|uniref:DNA breaking-rejoining protein n=1 Tax=Salmonella enterica TaxID=28901 RepID=A0A756L5Q0_SALER|nr:DNA breaking-rejoining protein [Salmonella enterica]